MKTNLIYAMALLFVMACGKEIPEARPGGGGSGAGAGPTASEARAFIVSPGYSQAEALTVFRTMTPVREVWADRNNGTYVVFTTEGAFSQAAGGVRTPITVSPIDVGYALVFLTGGRFDHADSKVYPPGWDTTPPATHPTVAGIAWCGGTYQAVCP